MTTPSSSAFSSNPFLRDERREGTMENGGGGGGGGIMSGGSVGQVPAPPSAAFSHISTAAGGVGGMGGGLLGDRSSFGSGASDASSSSSAASASAASSYPPPPPRGSTTTGGGYAPGALSTPRPGKGVGSSLPSYASTPAAGPYSAFPSRAASPLRPPTAGAATPSSHSYHHPAAAVVGGSAAEDGKQQGASLLELLYGSRVVLRGPHGVTLTARAPDDNAQAFPHHPAAAVPSTPGGAAVTPSTQVSACVGGGGAATAAMGGYRACTEGRGLGEARESLALMNCQRRDDKGPVTYGAVVALRCSWARERFLGVHNNEQAVGFFRTLVGAAEKWCLAKPDLIRAERSAHGGVSSSSSSASVGMGRQAAAVVAAAAAAAGKGVVRAGDRVVLQSQGANRAVLCVREVPGGGLEVGLVAPEAALLSHATWEIGWAGSPSYPAWNLTRPYLTGAFLADPSRHHPAVAHKPPPLGQFSLPAQERLLVEDLLWAVTGYEGRYIKLSTTSDKASRIDDQDEGAAMAVEFALVNAEGGDPSLVAMARKFLPLAAACVRVRRFVEVKRRYEYGMVAQALAAGLASVLREYAVQVAQLEHRHQQELLRRGGIGNGQGGGLSLQRLWLLLQPSLRTLAVLDALCTKVWRSKGGAMLSRMQAAASGGDERSAKMHAYLMERASAPYMSMLEGWIYRGQLDDPYNEFMVAEERGLSKEKVGEDFNAAYWDKRSTLRPEHVFPPLAEQAAQVLTTGKYLHVIRECGQAVPSPSPSSSVPDTEDTSSSCASAFPRLRYAAGKAALAAAIEGAYTRACDMLLDVVLRRHQLLSHLASIKHYFLLDTGDFFVHFMNSAEHELLRPVSDISPARIETLLHLAIQLSVAAHDPHKDGVSSAFVKHKLIEHLNAIHQSDIPSSSTILRPPLPSTPASSVASASAFLDEDTASSPGLPALPDVGSLSLLDDALVGGSGLREIGGGGAAGPGGPIKAYEALMLDYHAPWPLSLVLSRRAITKYQLLFRHLFLAKFVERRLHTAWAEQQGVKELDLRGALGAAFCLRHRMQHFLENYIHYMLFEVIEPHWHALQEALRRPGEKGVAHLDDVIRLHQEFQDTCLKECLLTNLPLLKTLHKVTVVCLLFARYMEQAASDFEAAAADAAAASVPAPAQGSVKGGGAADDVAKSSSRRQQKGVKDAGAARRARIEAATAGVRAAAAAGGFQRAVAAFSAHLDRHLREFMRRLREDSRAQYHSHLSNLLTRLDYNGFFGGGGLEGVGDGGVGVLCDGRGFG